MATKFNLPSYNYESLKQMDVNTLRKEYSRLRDVAHKRLMRLSQSDFAKSQTYLRYRNAFTGLKQIKKTQVSRLSKKLSDLYTFLNLETSTVSGSRATSRRIIKGLQERGYTYIKTDKDLRNFGNFMDFNRALKKGGKYDSQRVVEMMEETDKAGVTPKEVQKDFDFWMDNYKDIDKAKKKISGKKAGSKSWIKELISILS